MAEKAHLFLNLKQNCDEFCKLKYIRHECGTYHKGIILEKPFTEIHAFIHAQIQHNANCALRWVQSRSLCQGCTYDFLQHYAKLIADILSHASSKCNNLYGTSWASWAGGLLFLIYPSKLRKLENLPVRLNTTWLTKNFQFLCEHITIWFCEDA